MSVSRKELFISNYCMWQIHLLLSSLVKSQDEVECQASSFSKGRFLKAIQPHTQPPWESRKVQHSNWKWIETSSCYELRQQQFRAGWEESENSPGQSPRPTGRICWKGQSVLWSFDNPPVGEASPIPTGVSKNWQCGVDDEMNVQQEGSSFSFPFTEISKTNLRPNPHPPEG